MKYKLGIDPGVHNLGLAILDENNSLVMHRNYVPSSYPSFPDFIKSLEEDTSKYLKSIESAAIEKYVVYGRGTPSKSAIDTTMLVGALQYMFHTHGIKAELYKAIDWKKKACKALFKSEGFRNPSDKFDKKFSMACSLCICKEEVETDHEADAVGIAYTSSL